MSRQPIEPSDEHRQAWFAAGNTEHALNFRIEHGIPINHQFTRDCEFLLDGAQRIIGWRDNHHSSWQPTDTLLNNGHNIDHADADHAAAAADDDCDEL